MIIFTYLNSYSQKFDKKYFIAVTVIEGNIFSHYYRNVSVFCRENVIGSCTKDYA